MRTDWRTILTAAIAAGLAAAVVEMLVVLPIQGLLGASPVRVFQGIAAGALGRAALRGGLGSAGLGVCFHTLISVVAAGLYALAATRWTLLLRRPALMGILYGVPVYLVMNFVVIPLSALGFAFPNSLVLFSLSFGVHLFAFGLPIGLVCRWVMGRPPAAHP
ncbi:MAG TPA: hypothetical protein VGG29_00020 [Caulobacteraceae bacterium]|jgi:hypothetical protein